MTFFDDDLKAWGQEPEKKGTTKSAPQSKKIEPSLEWGNYSRVETIQGRKLFAEIRYWRYRFWLFNALVMIIVSLETKNSESALTVREAIQTKWLWLAQCCLWLLFILSNMKHEGNSYKNAFFNHILGKAPKWAIVCTYILGISGICM